MPPAGRSPGAVLGNEHTVAPVLKTRRRRKLRTQMLKANDYLCALCRTRLAGPREAVLDHIYPVNPDPPYPMLPNPDDPRNIQVTCHPCAQLKANVMTEEGVQVYTEIRGRSPLDRCPHCGRQG